MSIEAMTWALNVDVGDSTRKLVLIGYANHAHKNGRNAWASKPTVAEYVNCDPKTIGRQVKALLAEGWIRHGDQSAVAHLRADRRPVVYDLAMSETTRQQWKQAHANGDSSWGSEQRGDHWWTGGTDCPPADQAHEGTHGGTSETPRGDTAVSPKPSGTEEPSPYPPEDAQPLLSIVCTKPGPKPHVNCRGCRTTARLQAEAAQRAATERKRLEDQEYFAQRRAARATPTTASPDVIAKAKSHIRRDTP